MKKILSLVLVLTLALFAFVGCGNTEKEYSLSTGVAVTETLASSKVAQSVASIVTDANGKIVLCRLDCVEYSAYDRSGNIVTTAPTSKVDQGDAYDSYSPMKAGRWYQQAEALQNYVVGMTREQVAAIALEGGKATDTELSASCSIAISDLLKAIDNAFKSEHKITFKAKGTLTAGLNATSTVKTSGANITVSTTYSTAVLANGVVVGAILDTAEPQLVNVSADGADSLSYKGTKREQGTAYDSYSPMKAGTWYVQADVYAATAVGKTASNIATLATEGVAGCTIGVTAYKAGLEAAVNAAK